MLRLPAIIAQILTLLTICLSPIAYADDSFVDRKDVQTFINEMVKKDGFKSKYLTNLFKEVKVRPQVMKQIRKPLEKEPWRLYQMLFVNEWRITHGVEFWDKYKNALDRAEKTYGVPASIIVATIGIETRYGQRTGEHRVLDALSNIAFSDSPRAGFFRKELREFLLLTREQKLDPLTVMGSYAGAIGQPQFMPSSYRYYAVNFSGSGKTDLMNDEVDVIGSIANYYSKHGWRNNDPVAVKATLMANRYNAMMHDRNPNQAFSVDELSRFGIVPSTKIKHDKLKVKLIELDNTYSKEYWLGFPNFYVIKRYNQSDLYAMAVHLLSNYIEELRQEKKKG